MRYLPFFLFFSSHIFAQQSAVFKVYLPTQGILLDKGWKWQGGDNPNFAKVDFDDSKWESIDPTKDIFDLPQIPKTGQIGCSGLGLVLIVLLRGD